MPNPRAGHPFHSGSSSNEPFCNLQTTRGSMIVIVGVVIVLASVAGGFIMGGGHLGALIQIAEFVVICGAAFGALIIMSPKKVLIDLIKNALHTLKGTPYNKSSYSELFRVLYEM